MRGVLAQMAFLYVGGEVKRKYAQIMALFYIDIFQLGVDKMFINNGSLLLSMDGQRFLTKSMVII